MNKSYNLNFILLKPKKVSNPQLRFKMDLEISSNNENQIQNSPLNHQGWGRVIWSV